MSLPPPDLRPGEAAVGQLVGDPCEAALGDDRDEPADGAVDERVGDRGDALVGGARGGAGRKRGRLAGVQVRRMQGHRW